MGARVYLPRLAKFTSVDLVEPAVGDADYLYPTDPVNGNDLSGRVTFNKTFCKSTGVWAVVCALVVGALFAEETSRIDVAAKQNACLQARLSVSLFVQLSKLVEDGVGETDSDNAEKQGLHTIDIPGLAWSVDNGKHCFNG
jgi:hypothetical protein